MPQHRVPNKKVRTCTFYDIVSRSGATVYKDLNTYEEAEEIVVEWHPLQAARNGWCIVKVSRVDEETVVRRF